MAVPDYQTLMLPVLEIAARGESSVPLVEAEVAGMFNLNDTEREEMLQVRGNVCSIIAFIGPSLIWGKRDFSKVQNVDAL